MAHTWSFSFFVAMIAVVSAAPPGAENRIANPGFEEVEGGRPLRWSPAWSRDDGAIAATIATEDPHGGARCVRIVHTGKRDWSLGIDRELPVRAGEIYRIAGWIRGKPGTDANLGVILRDARGEVVSWIYAGRAIDPAPAWRRCDARFVIPEDGGRILPRLIGTGPGEIFLDDVELTLEGTVASLRPTDLPETIRIARDPLALEFRPRDHGIAIEDRRTNRRWEGRGSEGPIVVTEARKGSEHAIDLSVLDIPSDLALSIRVALEEDATVSFSIDAADRGAAFDGLAYPPRLATAFERGAACFSLYGDGLLIDQSDTKFPWPRLMTYQNLDMPWVGITDLARGDGVLILFETETDAAVEFARDERGAMWPGVRWPSTLGAFGSARRASFRFSPSGGYVALAKMYREHAKRCGYAKPLAEKARDVPNIALLRGAPDIWGADGLAFAREARAAGVRRALINGRFPPDEIRTMSKLGFLVGEYDNYVDILPGEPKDVHHASIEDEAIRLRSGEPCLGWLTLDGKTQYYKRSSALARRTAERFVPGILATYPYTARFCDVTPAEGLIEDYHPKHRQSRAQDLASKQRLLAYMHERGLVTGAEHGRAWAVPVTDYFEGMTSGGFYSWPAGHLVAPRARDEISEAYLAYGLGFASRIPLFELVFHDCVVTTWYWGDSSGWLYAVAPELSDRKDLFNMLWGTVPLLWANESGYGWRRNRARFLRTYRSTCLLHEVVGFDELLSHEYLSDDRALQRTRFSSGTVVTVNFASAPRTVSCGGADLTLAPNGFHAKGPGIDQAREWRDGGIVTRIRTSGFLFAEGGREARIDAAEGEPIRIIELDGALGRLREASWRRQGGAIRIALPSRSGAFAILEGEEAARPDPAVLGIEIDPDAPRQGATIRVTAILANHGGTPVETTASVLVDGRPSGIAPRSLTIDPGARIRAAWEMDTTALDGRHRIAVRVPGVEGEPIAGDDEASDIVVIRPDPRFWPLRASAIARNDATEREDEIASAPIDLAALFASSDKIDPGSIRVAESRGDGLSFVPAQVEPDPKAPGHGTLLWIVPGRMAPDEARWFEILAVPPGARKMAPPAEEAWDAATGTIRTPVYRLRLRDGAIGEVDYVAGRAEPLPVFSGIVYSSEASGWVTERGTVERLDVIAAGPIRTVIQVTKTLEGGARYTKVYTFYPSRFHVTATVAGGTSRDWCRAYYASEAEFEASGGRRARIDGRGDGEGIIGACPRPEWYAVWNPDWAHAAIAVTPAANVTYWDSSARGGISLSAAGSVPQTVAYVFHAGRGDAAFARADAARIRKPIAVRLTASTGR
ncbi:MAG: hypothetical protein JXP34_16185 [Planctomycetes bacterium]|nr:hypothetical protein [Planctomycetota bacterium]